MVIERHCTLRLITISLRSDGLVGVCLPFAVCHFSLVCHNVEQFVIACLLANGLKYGDKPGVLSKVPGVSQRLGEPVFSY